MNKKKIKEILFIEVWNTDLNIRIKNRLAAGKIKFLFQIILEYSRLLNYRSLGKKSLILIDKFLKKHSRKKVEKFVWEAVEKVGEIQLEDIPELLNSEEFEEFCKKFSEFKSNSKIKPVKPFEKNTLAQIYNVKEKHLEMDYILQGIQPRYQREFKNEYFFQELIKEVYFEKIMQELQKPD